MLLLQKAIQGDAPTEPVWVPPKTVVVRSSTDLLAVGDPNVAKAIRFLWDHLSWPITVDDVAYEVGIPKRTLTRTFKKHMRRSIHEELQRKRLELCRELLRTTRLTVEEICKRTGIKSKTHLHRLFREKVGVTPTDYRRSQ